MIGVKLQPRVRHDGAEAHVILLPTVLCIGFVNQCLNVVTLSQIPSSGFTYLKASAIADILSIIALIPFIVRHAGLHDQCSRTAMLFHAHIELPLVNALMCAGALCIVAMTIDRYLSICHPIKFFKSAVSRYNIHATITILFALSFIIFVPSGVFALAPEDEEQKCKGSRHSRCSFVIPSVLHFVPENEKKNVKATTNQRPRAKCEALKGWQKLTREVIDANNQTIWRIERNVELNNTNAFRIYLMFRECFAKIGPIVILVVLNFSIMRSLHKIGARRRSIRGRPNGTTRVSILLFITSTTFVICTLPASILSLFMDHFNNNSLPMQIFRAVANLLQATSYLYNFYLYALCSSEYRQALYTWIGLKHMESASKSSDSRSFKYSSVAMRNNAHDPNEWQDAFFRSPNALSYLTVVIELFCGTEYMILFANAVRYSRNEIMHYDAALVIWKNEDDCCV
uniref:G_PROTEIN_RECEP_F1_2 domain-containing protein n=1 Tax=Ascaris lumbricoides TaxID=6252 RepID=A0A0M3I5W7_ASCLU